MVVIDYQKNVEIKYKADVIVVGGGLAGCSAAIAAARKGCDVLLIEQSGVLGGMATLGHVSPLDATKTRSGKSFGGIMEEVINEICRLNKKYGDADADLRQAPELLKIILIKLMNEAGVKLLLHTTLTDVIRTSDSITKLILTTKAGLEGAQGKIFIDATGDGDLIARADEEYVLGSEPNVFDELVATGLDEVHFEEKNGSYKGYEQSGLMQPVSMMFTMGGADVNKCRHLCNKKLTFADLGIDSEEFKKLDYFGTNGFEENGDLIPMPQGRLHIVCAARRDQALVNMSRVINVDATDPVALSKAEEIAQVQMLYLVDFIIRFVPGFENAYLINSSSTLGVRETRRLVGKYVLKGREAIECVPFEDTVAHGSYMIDIHDPSGRQKAVGGELKGDCYYIPYRCLLPKNTNNLLVCGRCISVDHVAHASTRIQGTCMLTGQAVGTAASLALKSSVSPNTVKIKELRQELIDDGVYLLDI